MQHSISFTATFLLTFLLGLSGFSARAQADFASSVAYTSNGRGNASRPAAPAADPTEMVVLTGKITNPAGVLPGAVVILTATKQMAVTNADGEFEFVVPASAGPLAARVTYAGFADENMTLNGSAEPSTVNLANATVVVVARRQQLKYYLKTARRQVKRSLKQVHK